MCRHIVEDMSRLQPGIDSLPVQVDRVALELLINVAALLVPSDRHIVAMVRLTVQKIVAPDVRGQKRVDLEDLIGAWNKTELVTDERIDPRGVVVVSLRGLPLA